MFFYLFIYFWVGGAGGGVGDHSCGCDGFKTFGESERWKEIVMSTHSKAHDVSIGGDKISGRKKGKAKK